MNDAQSECKPEAKTLTMQVKPASGCSFKKFVKRHWQWVTICLLGASSLCLGWIGFREYYSDTNTTGPWDYLYLSIQAIFLGFNPREGRVVPTTLQIARYVGPLISAWAVLLGAATLIYHRVQTHALRYCKNHILVCGLGRKGLKIVTDFRKQGRRVVVIEGDADNGNIEICRTLGATVLIGDASSKFLLQSCHVQKAEAIFITLPTDQRSIEVAWQVREISQNTRKRDLAPLLCCMHLVDLRTYEIFRDLLQNDSDANIRFRLFNVYEETARQHLFLHPIDWIPVQAKDTRSYNLIIVGFGQMGQGIALHAAAIGHYANLRKIRISIIDQNAEKIRERFYARYPQFHKVCDARFVESDIEDPSTLRQIADWINEPNMISTVAFCFDDDWQNLTCALKLRSLQNGCDTPVCIRVSEEATIHALEISMNANGKKHHSIHPFGPVIQTQESILSDRNLDTLAETIHNRFVKAREAEGRPRTDPSMASWLDLDPTLKNSNYCQAAHIPVKLRAIGCQASPVPLSAKEVVRFEDDEVEILARMEHARWNADRFLDNWTLGAEDNKSKRITRWLVDYDQLPEEIKEYDREVVRAIPELLHSIGWRIYRMADSEK